VTFLLPFPEQTKILGHSSRRTQAARGLNRFTEGRKDRKEDVRVGSVFAVFASFCRFHSFQIRTTDDLEHCGMTLAFLTPWEAHGPDESIRGNDCKQTPARNQTKSCIVQEPFQREDCSQRGT
jgi:hypothetical protein